MKVIVDACLSRKVYETVKQICPDTIYINNLHHSPSDYSIMKMAYELDAIILTADRHFDDYELTYLMKTRLSKEAEILLKTLGIR